MKASPCGEEVGTGVVEESGCEEEDFCLKVRGSGEKANESSWGSRLASWAEGIM